MAHRLNPNIVCLGGGIGTVNLIKGLIDYPCHITVVVSMADDGGSAGRLRRLYSIPPPGDLVNCIHALSSADPILKELLVFRFEGDRWGRVDSLGGHKLGNLILLALTKKTGNFSLALAQLEKIFKTRGKILPSTVENISIWAKTTDGTDVYREETIDLGKYKGILDRLYIKPKTAHAPDGVIEAIKNADIIIAGPGDLYTTILPVLLVKSITSAIKKSTALKLFVVNIANKPFETPNYKVSDYINAIVKHCNDKLFDYFLANTNFEARIPRKFKYEYVTIDDKEIKRMYNGILKKADLADVTFPLYHDSKKLASFVLKQI